METVWVYRPAKGDKPASAPMRCLKDYRSKAYRMGYRDCAPEMVRAAESSGIPKKVERPVATDAPDENTVRYAAPLPARSRR